MVVRIVSVITYHIRKPILLAWLPHWNGEKKETIGELIGCGFDILGIEKEGESWIINGNEDGRKQRLVEHATLISTVRFASISGIVLIIWKSSRAMDHWGWDSDVTYHPFCSIHMVIAHLSHFYRLGLSGTYTKIN